MNVLIELYAPGAVEWEDDANHAWEDDANHEWGVIAGVLRASIDGVAASHYWPPWITAMDTIQYGIPNAWGGYAALSFGTLEFSPAAFDSDPTWPPPETFVFNLYYTADDGATKTFITTGTLFLAKITDSGIQYDVYGDSFDVNFLDEAVTYESVTAQPLPVAIGAVVQQNPVRLPDAGGGNQTWSKCGLAGVAHTNWHAYDDGVDICANVANEAADTFELTAAPVGEVTISGTGSLVTLADVAGEVCTLLGLSLDAAGARAVSPDLSTFITSQRAAIDVLSSIAAAHAHLFYIASSTLYLIDMLAATGTVTIADSNGVIDSEYSTQPPISLITHRWVDRYVAAAQIINETKKQHTVDVGQYFGDPTDINVYSTVVADIAAALANIVTLQARRLGRVTLPLSGTLPTPGAAYAIEDTTMVRDLSVTLYVRSVGYDFMGHRILIGGDCILT